MRANRRRAAWIAGALALLAPLIVALVTMRSGSPSPPPLARRPPPPAPRWAAPAASEKPPPPLDLDRLRRQLPGSRYWRDDAPTDDPAAAQRRLDDERRWNALYGKVLSGTASESEIDLYFQRLRQRSEDYLQVAEAALAQNPPQRERALLTLAVRMNHERLASLPRERDEALARKRLQDQRRAAWHTAQP
jgi:hypothetical protein